MKTFNIVVTEVEVETVKSTLNEYIKLHAKLGKSGLIPPDERRGLLAKLVILTIFSDKLTTVLGYDLPTMPPVLKKAVDEVTKVMIDSTKAPLTTNEGN